MTCQYQEKIEDEIRDELDPLGPLLEVVTYHDCPFIKVNQPCPYPARYCKVKEEADHFIGHFRYLAYGAIE